MATCRMIIAGGRDFDDYNYMTRSLEKVIEEYEDTTDFEVVSGMAEGADFLGIKFGFDYNFPVYPFEPKFYEYGKDAGIMRNIAMAEFAAKADIPLLCVFWNGRSRGTKHMIETAELRGIKVNVFLYDQR